MSYDVIVRQGRAVTPDGVRVADIGITDGRYVAIQDELSNVSAKREIDARGLTVLPGVLDAHVHFNDPGRSEWEGASTGSAALLAGGATLFVDMPLNSSPPTLDAASFRAKVDALQGACYTDFALYGGLTPGNLGQMEELAECGVVGFKAFMVPSGIDDFDYADDLTLLRGMEIAAKLDLPVLLHAESLPIIDALTREHLDPLTQNDSTANEASARESIGAFLKSRPIISELEAISRALLYARETRCRVHIVHVTNARGIYLVREAATSGRVDASCETCPHYLALSEDDLFELQTRAKCAPPLRPESERQALLAEVVAGNVDTIGSDHSPAPASMKSGSFLEAWGGIAGAQSTLRVLLSLGVPLESIATMTATNPARRFALPRKGAMVIGNDADLVILDPDEESVLTRDELRDRHKLSPYVGRSLKGSVKEVLLRGAPASVEPQGRLITPATRP